MAAGGLVFAMPEPAKVPNSARKRREFADPLGRRDTKAAPRADDGRHRFQIAPKSDLPEGSQLGRRHSDRRRLAYAGGPPPSSPMPRWACGDDAAIRRNARSERSDSQPTPSNRFHESVVRSIEAAGRGAGDVPDSRLTWGRLLTPTRRKTIHGGSESIGTGIGREEVERDYDRILFAAPTRRLADKTQVFPQDPNDSVRTRLTHSHEVSNLARSIGVRLAYEHRQAVFGDYANEAKVERTVPAVLAAAGLAHDLGNPPFGHQGEASMAQWCLAHTDCVENAADFKEFNGNCQTFRLLSRLQILNDSYGINLTCATLATMMKYPVFSDRRLGFKKFGLFQTERDVAKDVWEATGLDEGVRHPLVYVMEACDDIAYSVIDAEDTVKKRYASFNDLIDVLSGSSSHLTESVRRDVLKKNKEFAKEKLSPTELNELSMQMFRVKAIAEMVKAATCTFVRHINDILNVTIDRKFEIIGRSEAADLCTRLKDFDRSKGYENPDVLRLELRGHNYITQTMNWFWRSLSLDGRFEGYTYSRISENYRRVYESTARSKSDKLHLVCDAVSGMTDSYLISIHDELKGLQHGGGGSKP